MKTQTIIMVAVSIGIAVAMNPANWLANSPDKYFQVYHFAITHGEWGMFWEMTWRGLSFLTGWGCTVAGLFLALSYGVKKLTIPHRTS